MKEFIPILEFCGAIVAGVFVIPIGIIYTLAKGVVTFWRIKSVKKMLIFPFEILYQIWNAIKYLLRSLAIVIDLLGNATSGELFEDFVTEEDNTLFGKGNVTISAALGELESKSQLTKKGILFSKLLNFVFENNHAINAYNKMNCKCI